MGAGIHAAGALVVHASWFLPGQAASIHRTQPDAPRQPQRIAQSRSGLLGDAGGSRPLGHAVPLGTPFGCQHSVVSAAFVAPLYRAPIDGAPAQTVSARTADRIPATLVEDTRG